MLFSEQVRNNYPEQRVVDVVVCRRLLQQDVADFDVLLKARVGFPLSNLAVEQPALVRQEMAEGERAAADPGAADSRSGKVAIYAAAEVYVGGVLQEPKHRRGGDGLTDAGDVHPLIAVHGVCSRRFKLGPPKPIFSGPDHHAVLSDRVGKPDALACEGTAHVLFEQIHAEDLLCLDLVTARVEEALTRDESQQRYHCYSGELCESTAHVAHFSPSQHMAWETMQGDAATDYSVVAESVTAGACLRRKYYT